MNHLLFSSKALVMSFLSHKLLLGQHFITVDPDQAAPKEQPDLGLHYFLGFFFVRKQMIVILGKVL